MGTNPKLGEANPRRFGRYVRARRNELGDSHDDVAANGGPSDRTQTAIENGRGKIPRFETLSKYDKALGWEPGSAARTLRGGEPILAKSSSVGAEKLKELEAALARHGVKRIAARRHQVAAGGLEFDPDALDQLIDLLNSVPEPAAAAEPSPDDPPQAIDGDYAPPKTAQKRRRRGGGAD